MLFLLRLFATWSKSDYLSFGNDRKIDRLLTSGRSRVNRLLSIYSIKNQFISSETINVIIRTYMKSKWQIRKKSLLTIIAKWFFAPHFNASFLYFGNTNSTQHGQGFLPINHYLSKAHLLFQWIFAYRT